MSVSKSADGWEQRLLRLLNLRLASRWLDALMRLLSSLGSAWSSILLCIFLWVFPDSKVQATAVSLSVAGSHLLVQALKRSFRRLRPYVKWPAVRIVTSQLKDGSFPSGHTTAAFSIAGVFSITAQAATFPLWTLAGLVGLSRVYLGHHYPSDVLAGAVLGAGFSVLTTSFLV